MELAQALLPEFALIAIGWLLAKIPGWRESFWSPIERLTYWVLFPALLFYGNARAPIDLASAGPLVAGGYLVLAAGVLLAFAGGRVLRPERAPHGGLFQCAFRFNAYMALALAQRLHGAEGLASMALLLGFMVPFANVAAVWALTRGHGRELVLRELVTNPLILSCVGGLVYGGLGLPLPEVAATTLSRFGSAALVLGLLAVGAALRFEAVVRGGLYLPFVVAAKLVMLPVIAWGVARGLGLPPLAAATVLVYAAVPLPSSAYVLAARLNGAPDVVALCVTASVVASLVTLPVALVLFG